MAQAVFVPNLFHYIFKDEEAGGTPDSATIFIKQGQRDRTSGEG